MAILTTRCEPAGFDPVSSNEPNSHLNIGDTVLFGRESVILAVLKNVFELYCAQNRIQFILERIILWIGLERLIGHFSSLSVSLLAWEEGDERAKLAMEGKYQKEYQSLITRKTNRETNAALEWTLFNIYESQIPSKHRVIDFALYRGLHYLSSFLNWKEKHSWWIVRGKPSEFSDSVAVRNGFLKAA